VIMTKDLATFRAVTRPDGTVESFTEASGALQTDTGGLQNANINQFKPAGRQYSAVRPPGIGESNPGYASDRRVNGIDWRKSRATENRDDSTTFNYKGEVEHGSRHTSYDAWERIDKDGNTVASHVKYDSSFDQKFFGRHGDSIEISNVSQVDTTRRLNGE